MEHCAIKVGVTLVVTTHFNEVTQDYKLIVFSFQDFFEDHEGTNEMDYGNNDGIWC